MQKDYNKGNFIIGGLFTAINRDIDDQVLTELNTSAYTGGVDIMKYFMDRNFFMSMTGLFSVVEGSNKALVNIQQSSVHYYQRPDANYLTVDSFAKIIRGYGGKFQFGRSETGKLRFKEWISFRSPGLELNDIGYQQRADFIQQHFDLQYVENSPNTFLREYSFYFENEHIWNYGQQHESNSYVLSTYLHFINKWQFYAWIYRFQSGYDSRLLRGGPSYRMNPFWHIGTRVNTDWAKKVTFSFNANYGFDNLSNSYDYLVEPQLFFKLGNRFRLSTQFSYNVNNYDMMYAKTVKVADTNRYIMGRLNQTTYKVTFRANYNITAKMAIQYYGSPFISQGSYYHFRRITNPHHPSYFNRFLQFNNNDIVYNTSTNKYTVNDENNVVYDFDNPNFQMREFKSNFIFRWEFKPGSVLYFVWSHQRTNNDAPYLSSLKTSINDLFTKESDNVFILKLNYYFNI